MIESFSPEPLTPLTVEQALEAWGDHPLIWGGIPCPLLEADAPVAELEEYLYGLLEMLDGRPIILNVVDMVLPINEIERVQRIAEIVEESTERYETAAAQKDRRLLSASCWWSRFTSASSARWSGPASTCGPRWK